MKYSEITEITEAVRERFIKEHLKSCDAKSLKKYDRKKKESALHSIGYSRRKCAKKCWSKAVKWFLEKKLENGK